MSDQDHNSSEVQDFYERYPYPRPVESLDKYRERWQDRGRLRADFHLFWPAKPFSDDHTILIAGCGTSQAAKHAIRWPNAKVTGIDFSATSIAATAELKKKYSLDNLTLHQLPVERATELGSTFDKVVSTGVLHHLPDPDAGLAALRDVLKPGGAMYMMLYAPYGRTGIYMLQEFCRRLGITATDEGIRDLITALGSLPPGHPLETLLREAPDFRHEAALADALLHPQDRAYSVPQVFEFLGRGGMRFGRWLQQAPYSPNCGVIAQLPQAGRLSRLSPAEQYASIELFRGTMVTHSFIAYRDDADETSIDLSGDRWLGYVPIRLPDTICVEERLPDGAAGVLINRTHTYRDIYLPISADEKRMVEAINGVRTIGEIATDISPNVASEFFQKLWLYDQVVFDASGRS
ncbi:MAG TPA: class I SAM-dependent methyltransferase [Pyrinomonadaceae bacterium]|nr:class I SAM-dependent methyltransferase [Pyrinomonadaceae bacterium]